MPWVFALVLKWHENSEISPLGDASVIPRPMKFQTWIVNFRAEVCAKARSKRKGRKILKPSERLTNVFSGRQLGLVQEETLVVFYTRMPRETVRGQRGMKWRYGRNSFPRSKHPLQYRKWKTQTNGQSLNSLKASPVTQAENFLSMVGKMKNIVVWLSSSSRMSWFTSLETDAEILGMHLVQNWIRERKRAIWRQYPKRWTSWAKSLRAQFGGTTTWGNLIDKQTVAAM